MHGRRFRALRPSFILSFPQQPVVSGIVSKHRSINAAPQWYGHTLSHAHSSGFQCRNTSKKADYASPTLSVCSNSHEKQSMSEQSSFPELMKIKPLECCRKRGALMQLSAVKVNILASSSLHDRRLACSRWRVPVSYAPLACLSSDWTNLNRKFSDFRTAWWPACIDGKWEAGVVSEPRILNLQVIHDLSASSNCKLCYSCSVTAYFMRQWWRLMSRMSRQNMVESDVL